MGRGPRTGVTEGVYLSGLKNKDVLVQPVIEQINKFSDFQRQKPFIRINCVNSAFWQTRIAAILFAAFSVMSAAIFHADFSDQNQMIHFMRNISIAGGFLFLIVHGAGSYPLDSREKAR